MTTFDGTGPAAEAARAILESHDIKYERLARLSSGTMNDVYQVDRDLVVRLNRGAAAAQRFDRERELTSRLRGVAPIPALIEWGQLDGNSYQIWEFVEGEELADAWPRLDSASQRQVAEELCATLRQLHTIQFGKFGMICLDGRCYPSWPSFLFAEFRSCLDVVQSAAPSNGEKQHLLSSHVLF